MFINVTPKSWREAKAMFEDTAGWVFRGQGNLLWPMETTLFREANRLGLFQLSHPMLLHSELRLIDEFKRFAHHYEPKLPADEDILAWLATIQHYGGPTRLLDFTQSLYIAAFFAVDATETDAAVWAINSSSLELASYHRLNLYPTGNYRDILTAHEERLFYLEEGITDPPAVLPVEPSRLHERLWLQKGLFLVPTDPEKSFMENLASSFRRKATLFNSDRISRWNEKLKDRAQLEYGEPGYISVIRIILPRSIHGQILTDLESMNISAATLFPGLDGFARSLRHQIWPSALWLHQPA